MVKRTPLGRKKPLETSGTPTLRRTPPPVRKAVTTARDVVQGVKKPRPPRNTGPTITTRNLVFTRAGSCCERCGKNITRETGNYSIHHRKPRGMGGTKDPVANSPANLVLLCGSATTPDGCHTSVEKSRQAALSTGWIITRTADPAQVPVKMISGWWTLNPDGTKTPIARTYAGNT